MQINIRLEKPEDYFEVENLVRSAFYDVYRPGACEHLILHKTRGQDIFIDELDFIIEEVSKDNKKIIAQIMYCKGNIKEDNGNSLDVIVFGPISVLKEYQRKSYGSMIIEHSLKKAKMLGYKAVAITGNPNFYKRFGFVSGSSKNIFYSESKRSEEAPFFMVLELEKGYLDNIVGTFKEPSCYDVDAYELEVFDKKFIQNV